MGDDLLSHGRPSFLKILMGPLLRQEGRKYYLEWDSRWDVVKFC